MPVTGSGPISRSAEKLIDLVAASSTFRARIGPGTSDATARRHIHWPHTNELAQPIIRPLAVVMFGPFGYGPPYAGGSQLHLKPHGILRLIIEDDDRFPDETDQQDSAIDFANFIGDVIADIAGESAKDDALSILSIDQTRDIARTDVREDPSITPYWQAAFDVATGWS